MGRARYQYNADVSLSRCLRVHFCPAVSPPCPTGPAHSSTQTRPRAPTTCTCANLFGRNQINEKKRQRSTLLQHFCNNSSANCNNKNNKEVADIFVPLHNHSLIAFSLYFVIANRRTPRVTIEQPPAPQTPLIGYILLTLPTLLLPLSRSLLTKFINPFTKLACNNATPRTLPRTLFPTKGINNRKHHYHQHNIQINQLPDARCRTQRDAGFDDSARRSLRY